MLIFSFKHDKLRQLIDLITVHPPAEADHNRGHKWPFLAAEIFNFELTPIMDKFFEAPEIAAEQELEDPEAEFKTPLVDKDDEVINEDTFQVQIETVEKVTNKEEPQVEAVHKYALIDRAFKFLEANEPVNNVLAGYFSKLVVMLANRR